MINKAQSSSVCFFDDDNPKPAFEFTKPNQKHQKDLITPPILVATFACKDLSSNTTYQNTYGLHNGLLASYPNGVSNPPETVLEISYARLKYIAINQPTVNDGVCLVKNGNSIELVFPDTQVAEDWFTALKKICVMTNFHEEYKASKMIGKGSFAKVYLVESKSDGKQYAVKAFAKECISMSGKSNPKLIMLNEINIMRAMDHDHIIKLYEVHETERSLYLVMELIEGKSLQEPLTKYTFKKDYSEKKVMQMMYSILDALSYIASKGIMHRDLKPDNILIEKGGKLKIVDFGLATYINEPEYIFKKCGTPGYIAPEVFRYDPKIPATAYDARCDVLSAGCIFFYMLFGYPFFDGSGASEILHLNKEFAEFHATHMIKKEINDPKSKLNKEALNLLLQLLEYNPKVRLTATQALAHPYFAPISTSNSNISSYKEALLEHKNSYTECASPTLGANSIKSESEKGSPLDMSRNRFTQKDSLYLDVGKPEFTGKVKTLAQGSAVNSLNMKGDNSSSNPNSVSGFARGTTLSEKTKGNKSVKGHTGVGNQSFLKAAIFNNMQKNNEHGTEGRGDEIQGPRFHRSHSDHIPPSNGTSSPSSGSEEWDDVGNENCQIDENFEKMNSDDSSKRMWQPGAKLRLAAQKN